MPGVRRRKFQKMSLLFIRLHPTGLSRSSSLRPQPSEDSLYTSPFVNDELKRWALTDIDGEKVWGESMGERAS